MIGDIANTPVYRWPIHFEERTYASSDEVTKLRSCYGNVASHYHSAVSSENLIQKFYLVATTWKHELKNSSSLHDLLLNESYLKMIALGSPVLPLIFKEYKNDRSIQWVIALRAITGINPVAHELAGNTEETANAWLRWAQSKGYVTFS